MPKIWRVACHADSVFRIARLTGSRETIPRVPVDGSASSPQSAAATLHLTMACATHSSLACSAWVVCQRVRPPYATTASSHRSSMISPRSPVESRWSNDCFLRLSPGHVFYEPSRSSPTWQVASTLCRNVSPCPRSAWRPVAFGFLRLRRSLVVTSCCFVAA